MRAEEQVTLGRTSVPVSRLSLGGTPFGDMYDTVPDEQAVATVHRAHELGVAYFDTAPLYGVGKSERRLGLGLRDLPRDDVTVSTKIGRILQDHDGTIPPTFEYTPEAIARSLEGSHARTGLDRFDIVHVHDPYEFMDLVLETTFPTLRKLQADGVIGAVGAGMNHGPQLARFAAAGAVDCVLLAGRWTLLEQSAFDDLLPVAIEKDVSVIAAGVFNTGVLADPDADPKLLNYFYQPAPPEILDKVARMRAVCERHGIPLSAAALQFPFTHPSVATVLIGCRTPQEVEKNVADLAVDIPHALWQDLADAGLLRPDVVPTR